MRTPLSLALGLTLLVTLLAGPAAAQTLDGQVLPTKGASATAQVEIVEVSDFQCPFCSRVTPTLKQIAEKWPDQVRFTFVHLPLGFHQRARPAALAASAAQRQGKFWEMHDLLFTNQKALDDGDLKRYAKELGLDMKRFEADLKDAKLGAFVDLQAKLAGSVGARGTPNFFINGTSLRGAQPFDKFSEVVGTEIAAAEKADQAGPKWLAARLATQNADLHGYLYGGKVPSGAAPDSDPAPPKPIAEEAVYRVTVGAKDPATGGDRKGHALVTMVVFSDFQCPFCKRLAPVMKDLQKKYGKDLKVVFKNLPLSFHNRAFASAEAALCAHDQKKFWKMHDLLFENQRQLEDQDLESYAKKAGVKMKKWKACMEGHEREAHIKAEISLAADVTARGTPNSFVNGRKITGARPLEDFVKVIDEELAKAKERVADGTRRADVYAEIIKEGKVFEPVEAKAHAFDNSRSPRLGPEDAAVTVTVFSDFQCPYCSRVAAPLRELRGHYGDNVAVVFKHFPLSFHKEAMPAAHAAMCGHAQGAFWAFHDELFDNQRDLDVDLFERVAADYELNLAEFARCLIEEPYTKAIEADMAEARAAEVRGTPTLFINGRKFSPTGGYNLKTFTDTIDKYILEGKTLPDRPATIYDPVAARKKYEQARKLERTDVRQAIKLYQQAADGGQPKALHRLGLLYIKQGDQKRAAAALRSFLQQVPGSSEAAAIEEIIERLGD